MMMMRKMTMTATIMMLLQVGPGDYYVLTVGGFNDAKSTLGGSMGHNNGTKFSTK